MIRALAHVCLRAANLAKTRVFYCDVLGLKKKFDFVKNSEVFGFYLEINADNFIEVFQGDKIKDASLLPRLIQHICFEVEDINTLEKCLAEHNIASRGKKLGADQSWQLWCQDPDGVDIEFHAYTDKSCQRTGQVCRLDT